MTRRAVDVDAYAADVLAGRRAAVARAITLVESSRPADRDAARRLLTTLAPYTGGAQRVGVTGVPGAGKSTFIDALGSRLTAAGHRVAVLAVDPSSERTGGSILGDRTRMARLAADPAAYVRPTPSSGALGGVAGATQHAIAVVEAAGHDVVIVETVGVGQAETLVAELVDTFLLMAVAGTGDEIQGIKMGVLERADVIAVNKADGPGADPARRAAREIAVARRLLTAGAGRTAPPVLTCSARDGTGIAEVWDRVRAHYLGLAASGALAVRRREQAVTRMRTMLRAAVLDLLAADPAMSAATASLEEAVRAGDIEPVDAVERITTLLVGDGHSFSVHPSTAPEGLPPMTDLHDDLGLLGVDHVGIAVPDLDEAISFHTRLFGMRCVHQEENPEQGVREAMLEVGGPGGTRIQLLAPLSEQSPIARFIERRGRGVQQVAYRVADIELASRRLRARGAELLYETPRTGTAGSLVNFVHPRSAAGVLVEIVQIAPEKP